MDIKETADDLIAKGKAVLDADGDGKVEAKEVLDALSKRAQETVEAAATAAEEVKQGFDANADGDVTLEEVGYIARGVANMAKGAADDIVNKLKGE